MPSGSKKRKAAKKKKGQVTNNVKSSINNNPYGNDDTKSQGKRDSDGSDVGSRASMDDHNNHQHPFNHSEDERERARSHIEESHVTEEKFVEEAARDVKFTEKHGSDDVETTRVRIQHDLEPLRRSQRKKPVMLVLKLPHMAMRISRLLSCLKEFRKLLKMDLVIPGTVIYSQPLVASTHPMLQRTSLLSCCGLMF